MPSSLPRVSLAGLNLTGAYLSRWAALKHARDVLEWYLSFDRDPAKAEELLAGVRSLDLSENRLEGQSGQSARVRGWANHMSETTAMLTFGVCLCLIEFPAWLPSIFPFLETLSLAHNAFRFVPPWITLFHHLRRLRTHGNQLARPGRQRGRVKHNTKEVIRELRAIPLGTEAGAGLETLVVVCAQVIRNARRDEKEDGLARELSELGLDNAEFKAGTKDRTGLGSRSAASPSRTATPTEGALPLHIERLVHESYECCSCHAFVPTTSPAFVGPLYERVHHLDPGVSLPARLSPHSPSLARPLLAPAPDSSPAPLMAQPPPLPAAFPSPTSAVHALAIPPARPGRASRSSSFASNSPPLSTSPSPGVSPVQAAFPPAPHRLTLEEKVYLLLMGRGLDVTPFVVGDEEGYRFCAGCARRHLGVEQGACACGVCVGERRWREEEEGVEGGVMRWLRRKTGRGRS